MKLAYVINQLTELMRQVGGDAEVVVKRASGYISAGKTDIEHELADFTHDTSTGATRVLIHTSSDSPSAWRPTQADAQGNPTDVPPGTHLPDQLQKFKDGDAAPSGGEPLSGATTPA